MRFSLKSRKIPTRRSNGLIPSEKPDPLKPQTFDLRQDPLLSWAFRPPRRSRCLPLKKSFSLFFFPSRSYLPHPSQNELNRASGSFAISSLALCPFRAAGLLGLSHQLPSAISLKHQPLTDYLFISVALIPLRKLSSTSL
jgi:hypothetical protein